MYSIIHAFSEAILMQHVQYFYFFLSSLLLLLVVVVFVCEHSSACLEMEMPLVSLTEVMCTYYSGRWVNPRIRLPIAASTRIHRVRIVVFQQGGTKESLFRTACGSQQVLHIQFLLCVKVTSTGARRDDFEQFCGTPLFNVTQSLKSRMFVSRDSTGGCGSEKRGGKVEDVFCSWAKVAFMETADWNMLP